MVLSVGKKEVSLAKSGRTQKLSKVLELI